MQSIIKPIFGIRSNASLRVFASPSWRSQRTPPITQEKVIPYKAETSFTESQARITHRENLETIEKSEKDKQSFERERERVNGWRQFGRFPGGCGSRRTVHSIQYLRQSVRDHDQVPAPDHAYWPRCLWNCLVSNNHIQNLKHVPLCIWNKMFQMFYFFNRRVVLFRFTGFLESREREREQAL